MLASSSNKFNFGLGFSSLTLVLELLLFSTLFKLIPIFGISFSLSSSKKDNFGFVSFCFWVSSNKLVLGLFISSFWGCWFSDINTFTFFVISSVLSTIFPESISSSSSLSNIDFNLFFASSKPLFFFIVIELVSCWLLNIPNWGFIICGCSICCWTIGICIWGAFIICGCPIIIGFWTWGWDGVDWIFCSWVGVGLGIPMIIIGWPIFWLIWGFWFWAILDSGCGYETIGWVFFFLKILVLRSSSSSSSFSPPKTSAVPRKAFNLTFSLFIIIFLSLITGAKGFLLSASVCNKSDTELGLTLFLFSFTSELLLVFVLIP